MKIIYLIAFLSGLFLTLSAYILYGQILNIPYTKEGFQIQNNNPQTQNVSSSENTEEKIDIHTALTLPKAEHNFMILTTFNNANKIKNQELRWYDDKTQMDNILMTDFNKGTYFSLGNVVTYETDKLVNNKTFRERFFSLKALHGFCMTFSWYQMFGRTIVTNPAKWSGCWTYPCYKNTLEYIPTIDPNYSLNDNTFLIFITIPGVLILLLTGIVYSYCASRNK